MNDAPRRGGRRSPPGGRPRKDNVRLVGYVRPETSAAVERLAQGTTIGAVLDQLVAPLVADEDRDQKRSV